MKGGKISRKYILFGVIVIVIIGVILSFVFGIFNPLGSQGPQGCNVSPGEWVPKQGECENQEMQNKCNEFCLNHPDCCPDWAQTNYTSSLGDPGKTLLPLPSESNVTSLTRNYVTTIKAINEGVNIYPINEKPSVISDDELQKIKDAGFNTVQVYLVGRWENNKIIQNDVNNAILLNDIVAIKKKGLAVWIALDPSGGKEINLSGYDYQKYKSAYANLVNISSSLMEKYKVEYLTVNNELDHFFTLENIAESNLVDIYPFTNELAKKNFNGKLINKITGPRSHSDEILAASFKNVDIAGVDVGPFISENRPISDYKEQFNDYQFYATKANAAGIPWMNAEYWIGDFGIEPSQFVKNNELEFVTIPFEYYLNVTPKGVGYTYNEISTFSWEPQGEQTRLAMKDFLGKI